MTTVTEERVSAVVISGPRKGEVVLLDPEVVSQAPVAEDVESLTMLNKALDTLNVALDRFIAAIRASANDYAVAAQRMERGR
ncbi:MAG: hypothetical protein NZT92_05170 [Abditibacteriales bacterium]|nr:hypothetical protein [Abditibacteriales bacterium]MDW8366153.1 hypothetical protein [Abditibacteriales bacterium]